MIRRTFLKNTGCLTIGFMLGKPLVSAAMDGVIADQLPGSLQRHPNINAWLQIRADGSLLVYTGKMELGQGIRTAIAQVAAEELDMRMDQVEVKLAETGVTPDEGYTAGSGSIDNSAMSVRYAAAAARAKLLELAATALGTKAELLDMQHGTITQKNPKRSISFSKLLAGKQITDRVTLPVSLKPKSSHKLVGKAIPRADIRDMVRGAPVYLQDLRFPGMLHARTLRPPSYACTLESFDEAALKTQFPSLVKAVVDGSFVGIITEDEYTAVQIQQVAQNFLKWRTDEPVIPPGNTDIKGYLKSIAGKIQDVKKSGTPVFDAGNGSIIHEAAYYKPYMMHASIGPSCSVALYDKNILHIWSHSQGIYPLRATMQKYLDIPLENIHITGVPGSGCYGHNGADDASVEAAIFAMNYPGKHIRLQWSRADEHAWEPYGSAMIMEAKARLSKEGKITDWKYNVWTDNHSSRPGGNPDNLLTAKYTRKKFNGRPGGFNAGGHRNSEPYYKIPNKQIEAQFFEGPLRVSSLRSLGAYGNVFAIESFMEELAEKAGIDSYEFRLRNLEDPRAKAVLERLREMTKKAATGRAAGFARTTGERAGTAEFKYGTGIAFSRYKNTASYCAVAAVVRVDVAANEIHIEKMFSAIDAGEAINTDGIINQTEGGMIQAASWTMQEEVKFNQHGIQSLDWKSYPIFRFSEVPETFVEVIDNPANGPMGAGEAAQGPAAAAIANAIYYATGRRCRELPIIKIPLPKE